MKSSVTHPSERDRRCDRSRASISDATCQARGYCLTDKHATMRICRKCVEIFTRGMAARSCECTHARIEEAEVESELTTRGLKITCTQQVGVWLAHQASAGAGRRSTQRVTRCFKRARAACCAHACMYKDTQEHTPGLRLRPPTTILAPKDLRADM
jgi:hypothetical protein